MKIARIDNYTMQVKQAQGWFLRYDQEALIKKLKLQGDDNYIYVKLLCKTYRIARTTGLVEDLADSFGEASSTEAKMHPMKMGCIRTISP